MSMIGIPVSVYYARRYVDSRFATGAIKGRLTNRQSRLNHIGMARKGKYINVGDPFRGLNILFSGTSCRPTQCRIPRGYTYVYPEGEVTVRSSKRKGYRTNCVIKGTVPGKYFDDAKWIDNPFGTTDKIHDTEFDTAQTLTSFRAAMVAAGGVLRK